MANRYWIGGTGNWSDISHWSESSNGIGGFSVPTSSDNVYLDNNSGTGIITVNAEASTLDFNASMLSQSITLSSSAYNFNIYGNISLSNYLTWTFTGTAYTYFKATTSVTLTMNGCIPSFNRLYMNGVNGKWTLQDNMDCGIINPWYFINGEFDTNNYNVTKTSVGDLSWQVDSGVKKITLGSSIITLGNGIYFSTAYSGLTLDSGTSTVKLSGDWCVGGGKTWYNIEITSNKAMGGSVSDLTCNNLTRTFTTSLTSNLPLGSNITVNGILTLTGVSPGLRLIVLSNSLGISRTITCNGTINASNVVFRDISGSGTANWDLSEIDGGSGDCGGNSGIIFTSSQPQYFKHTSGGVSWSDTTKWVTSSGGSTQGRVPLPQDYAIFDQNSFTGTSTLNINVYRFGTIDFSSITQSISVGLANDIEIYGDFILSSFITTFNFGAYSQYFNGRVGNYIIDLKGHTPYAPTFNALNSKYTFLSTCSGVITTYVMNYGTVDFNDLNISIRYISVNNNSVLYMGNGIITTNRSNGGSIQISTASTIYSENSTLKFNTTSGSTNLNSNFGGKTFNKVWFSGSHTGTYDISSSNVFNEIIIDSGRTVRFTGGTTQQVGKFTTMTTNGNPITITSTSTTSFTLNYTGNDIVDSNYLVLSYSTVTPNYKWYAGSNSIDDGNNSGWVFSSPKRNILISQGPSIQVANDDSEAITMLSSLSGIKFTTIVEALAWVAQNNNILVMNNSSIPFVTDGLVLNIDAGNISSYPGTGINWFDLSGNNNNAKFINSPTFDSTSDYIRCDGIDDYIEILNNSSLDFGSGDFTVEYWFRKLATTTSYDNIWGVNKWNTGGSPGTNEWTLSIGQQNDNQYVFIVQSGNTSYTTGYNSSYVINLNTWYQLIGIREGDTLKTYLNGILQHNITPSGFSSSTVINSVGRNLRIANSAINAYYTNSDSKLVRLYNRSLSQSEVLQNYYQGPIVTDGLVFMIDAGNIISFDGSTSTYNLGSAGGTGSLINGVGYDNNNFGSFVFDGINDYILVGGSTFDYNSIGGWIKTSTESSEQIIISGFMVSDVPGCIGIQNGYLVWTRGSIAKRRYTIKKVNDNNWHHFHLNKISSSDFIMYIDGIISTYDQVVSNDRTSNLPIIGSRYLSTYELFFSGQISKIYMYNITLSESQILQNLNTSNP